MHTLNWIELFMRELLLLRHAKSSWTDPTLADHQRPLNPRGRNAAPRIGSLVRKLELLPDLILSSDSVRTRETVELFNSTAECHADVRFLPELYHASHQELLECAQTCEEAHRVMLVAHNPGMEDLYESLSGEFQAFPTAAFAAFRIDIENWSQSIGCEKVTPLGLWRPKELPD